MGIRVYLDNAWGFTEQFSEELTKDDYEGALREVRLPHTCVETPLHYFDESIYQMVSGYRRILHAPEQWEGKRVCLTFDGVAHACRVFLNGEQVGEHHCGYTAFSVELTGKLRLGRDNVLAVEVDSRESLNVPPFGYVIDYMTFGGIYRDAYLDVFEEAYLEDIFVSTVQMTGHRVRSRIKVNSVHPVQYVIKRMKENMAFWESRSFPLTWIPRRRRSAPADLRMRTVSLEPWISQWMAGKTWERSSIGTLIIRPYIRSKRSFLMVRDFWMSVLTSLDSVP